MSSPSNAMLVLTALRDVLGAVTWGTDNTVKTARIGLESGLSADDYPIVRIVPSALRFSDLQQARLAGLRQCECLVYFGMPVVEADSGLEGLYAELFAMEQALIAALPTYGDYVARWQETLTDKDRVPGYKLMALRVLVDG